MNGDVISAMDRNIVWKALRAGTLEMHLGPFTARLKGGNAALLDFLFDTYRDVPIRTELSDVTDIALHIKSPSLLRTYIRPQVIFDPGFEVPALPLPGNMSALALEMGMNLVVALKCCRYVTFHAGVVAGEKGGILISANSGGGKSTLTATLMEEGYRLLSDEFGLLSMEDGTLAAYPRPVSLKNESINLVREMCGAESISPILTGTPKGEIAYRRARARDIQDANQTVKTKIIIFPNFNPNGDHYAREVPSSEVMMRLIPSSINYHLLGEGAYLALSEMASNATAYEIGYRNTEESQVILRDLAEAHEL